VFGAAAVKFRSTRSGAAWRSCLAGWFSSVCAGERRQCELSHQPRYPFAAHQDALTGQHGVDARRAVAAARPLPDRFNPLRHRRISHRPCRRLSAAAGIKGGHRFTDRGEQRRNPEGVTMCLRKGRDLRRVGSASWAKNALANLKLPFGDGVRRRAWLSNRHGRLMTPPDD